MGLPPRSAYEQRSKTPQEEAGECMRGIQMGFLMGTAVGTSLGAIIMSIVLLPRGVRGKEFWILTGRTSLKMALTFGTFMSIGGALRCEENTDELKYNNNNNSNNNYNKLPSIIEFNNKINKFKNIC